MSHNPPQQWYLEVTLAARNALGSLSPSTRSTLFRQLQLLLEAEDPYSLTFVAKLKEKRLEGYRRFRVGNFRVTFAVTPGNVSQEKYIYKGILYIASITDRKDSYRK